MGRCRLPIRACRRLFRGLVRTLETQTPRPSLRGRYRSPRPTQRLPLEALQQSSREEVDGLVAKAVAAGGSTYDKPEDYGFMYTHSFVDPDGHGWGLVHMS